MKTWMSILGVVVVAGLLLGTFITVPGTDSENPVDDPDDVGPKGDIALGVQQIGMQVGSPESDQDPEAEKYTVSVGAENELTLNQYIANALGISDYNTGSLSVSDTWSEDTWVTIRPLNNKIYWKTANISEVNSLTINFTAKTADGYDLMIQRDKVAYITEKDIGLSIDTSPDNTHVMGTGISFDVKMTSDGYTQKLYLRTLDDAELSVKFTIKATDEAGRTVTDDIEIKLSMHLDGTTLLMDIEQIE